jgi:hypothetical protein
VNSDLYFLLLITPLVKKKTYENPKIVPAKISLTSNLYSLNFNEVVPHNIFTFSYLVKCEYVKIRPICGKIHISQV